MNLPSAVHVDTGVGTNGENTARDDGKCVLRTGYGGRIVVYTPNFGGAAGVAPARFTRESSE